MNVTELARKLKITPNELREQLPGLGFDIGRKAIKINSNVARKIIKEWPKLKRQIEHKKLQEQKQAEAEKEKSAEKNRSQKNRFSAKLYYRAGFFKFNRAAFKRHSG